jgi:secreted trypsin-like serine protease
MISFIFVLGLAACATAQRYNLTVVDHEFEIPLRIVNGIEAQKHEFPFIARLTVIWGQDAGLCGGSLINEKYVLTAAHCFYHPVTKQFATEVHVYLGDHNRNVAEPDRIKVFGVNVVLNQYDASIHYNDVAIVELDRTVTYTNNIKPVCIAKAGSSHVGQVGTAAGWGALGSSLPTSDVLRKVQIPVLKDTDCSRYTFYSDVMLCGGYTDGSRDTCQGDSGGPLVVRTGNGYTLVGATSFGHGCASPGFPGVYAKISHFADWVSQTAGKICTQ